MENLESGKVPQKTIDSKGNIIDKPYGVSRWSSPRIRPCLHQDCENGATVLRISDEDISKAHNCCTEHEESQLTR